VSLQIRYVYTLGGQRVLGEWCWVVNGEYYYTSPEMSGWAVTVQARETDGCPPRQPRRTDHNRRWRKKEKRAALRAAAAASPAGP